VLRSLPRQGRGQGRGQQARPRGSGRRPGLPGSGQRRARLLRTRMMNGSERPMPRDSHTPRPKAIRPTAVVFREAIAKAEAEGVDKDGLILRLTLRDGADLKRDRTLALSDISFSDGEMRFLGV